MPSVGQLTEYKRPSGSGIRVDDGFEEGMEIPIYYDPMIAKLITYGTNRKEAIRKMKDAIAQYKITGPQTTLPFGRFVMDHDAFVNGNFDTHFVKKYFSKESFSEMDEDARSIAAKIALKIYLSKREQLQSNNENKLPWRQ